MKATKDEIAQRLEQILRLRLTGAMFHDIVQYAAENGWGINERQLRNYIGRTDDLLLERQENRRERLIARHLAQRQALFARAVNAADFRTALAVLSDEAKLHGLYSTPSPKTPEPAKDGSHGQLDFVARLAAMLAREEPLPTAAEDAPGGMSSDTPVDADAGAAVPGVSE